MPDSSQHDVSPEVGSLRDARVFIFGLGFSSLAFVRRTAGRVASIAGTVRTEEKAARLRAAGIDALVFDGHHATGSVREALGTATHLVQSVAPGDAGDPVLAIFESDIRAAPDLSWIGYLSTVGVYGDHGGGWVDETTMPRPGSRRALNRVEAEASWTALGAERGIPVALLRLAGIYGPGRNTFVNLEEGSARRLVKPGQIFNRIHVDDIAAVIEAAATRGASGVFNVTDDEPAPPQDVVAFAASLAGYAPLPDIPFETADLSPMARSFYAENKRVGNGRLAELGVTLRYPTYRDALTALWQSGAWRGR
ncbi:SDR family oxidoreductase [Kaistia geumhonensis]|uniref:Nucleoside-diphosphate-sugar epimerase n=1 Tax=Kaistia geumhonensis TaxID=410839 RepID=A0ABU0M6T5_9HYPH|nr:SDR family oxidoreductase [Kaistia geumhonensis]MCX5478275.1 SDR family oxidoreductase [Kaistia geumhonensis]MDQ0516508.1 nucleoside-diphosphate-sugar epimerase [Kaistia geumhonensis]